MTTGALFGLAAAALFGASAPIAKRLLPGTSPLLLAALLYLGAAAGLLVTRPLWRRTAAREARLGRRDLPLLAGITIAGGALGPFLMLLGLARLSGVAGALLLNLEAPFTMLLAVTVFGEHLSRREAGAAALIVLGAALLGFRPGAVQLDSIGLACVAGACLCWALDNNLSQRLTLRDPLAVVQVKTTAAGTGTLLLALATGATAPALPILGGALLLGSLSYGLSLVLDMHALRRLGAAREAALFATAPFIGALLAIPLCKERPAAWDLAATATMAAGLVLLLRARHGHLHTHEAIEHEHAHVHDEHHQHTHDGPITEPHTHRHRHEPLTHDHPHVSDLHHRHRH